jgi:hypothetical protein
MRVGSQVAVVKNELEDYLKAPETAVANETTGMVESAMS